jgi:hypothetical protein
MYTELEHALIWLTAPESAAPNVLTRGEEEDGPVLDAMLSLTRDLVREALSNLFT